MKNVASAKWTLAVVAVAAVVGLALLSIASAEAVQSGQTTSDEEVAARIQAELEARLAQVRTRLEQQIVELHAVREHELRRVQEQLRGQAPDEALRHARESAQRALASAQRDIQRVQRAVTIRGIGGCDSYGELVLDYAEELELAEDQTEAIRAIRRAARRAGIERRADIEVGEMDLEALYEADDPDLAAVRAKLEELAMLEVDKKMAGFTLRREVRSTLTEAQLDELDEMGADHDRIRIVVSGWPTSSNFGLIGC